MTKHTTTGTQYIHSYDVILNWLAVWTMVYNVMSFSHALSLYYIIIFTVINLEKMQNCILYTNITDIRKWLSSYSLTLVKILHYYQTSHYQMSSSSCNFLSFMIQLVMHLVLDRGFSKSHLAYKHISNKLLTEWIVPFDNPFCVFSLISYVTQGKLCILCSVLNKKALCYILHAQPFLLPQCIPHSEDIK